MLAVTASCSSAKNGFDSFYLFVYVYVCDYVHQDEAQIN